MVLRQDGARQLFGEAVGSSSHDVSLVGAGWAGLGLGLGLGCSPAHLGG